MKIEDIYTNYLDQEFLKFGYGSFTVSLKNQFVQMISDRKSLPFTSITEQFIFEYHKELKQEFIKLQCEEDVLTGFTASNGHVYRTNRDDQTNMIGQKDFLNDHPEVATVKWKTEDQGYIIHTREEWLKIYLEAFYNKMMKLEKYNQLKEKIRLATTEAEIIAVDWDSVELPVESEEPEEETQPTE
ncbi:DUF4376 domain-containing protein [Priestia megaterium]|uniref:DUF4376 domain-containing protein n=1 Tax=Priestia megaterium TaxID=1404 RepID=UPI000BFC0913|nr:hypothetical protein [Priestia megaterium]PGO60731.1 hypothetical protein CN981_09340 [Priestia megaterium]